MTVHIRIDTVVAAPIERVFDLARDIDFHQRSMAHTGERAIGGRRSGLIELGETVTWRARHVGLTWSLTSRITAIDRPVRFVDEQVAGPFARFRHEHRFEAIPGGTRRIDDWRHAAPFGILGRAVDAIVLGPLLGPLLGRLLRTRAAALVREAEGLDAG